MDKLDEIFKKQEELNSHISEKRHFDDNWDFQTAIEKHAIALNCEMTEVMEETNYKWWKNNKKIDMSKVKEELIDVLHFYISMCLDAGMTSDELFDIYMGKNDENYKRQDGTSAKPGYDINDKR